MEKRVLKEVGCRRRGVTIRGLMPKKLCIGGRVLCSESRRGKNGRAESEGSRKHSTQGVWKYGNGKKGREKKVGRIFWCVKRALGSRKACACGGKKAKRNEKIQYRPDEGYTPLQRTH